MARKYQAIWERCKKFGKCTVEVEPPFFSRVIKAVIKEKDKDLGFKVLNDHDSFRLTIERKPETKRITFILKGKFATMLGLKGAQV